MRLQKIVILRLRRPVLVQKKDSVDLLNGSTNNTHKPADTLVALIFHIAQAKDVDQAAQSGAYSCDSIASEGFIHCCKPEQLKGVIERYYSGATGLLLLHIDSDLLRSELVFENTVGGEELFPHVYGEINMDAVVQIASV